MSEPSIVPAGDCALRVVFDNKIDPSINQLVNSLDKKLTELSVPGVAETIPAFRVLTVLYDPEITDLGILSEAIRQLLSDQNEMDSREKRVVHIPVCYDRSFGPDLEELSRHSGLSIEEIIAVHSGRDYLIYMMGFLPGFAYLGGLDPSLHIPRLDTPRTSIEAGAVGIAGSQTGMYPIASPGGWRLIGSTPVILFDPNRSEPFLYEAGDYIRFEPVSREVYDQIKADCREGIYKYQVTMEVDGGGHSGNQ
ncbi:5-oxoprolinase subunit PxpB [Alkalibacterium pelagium]|uniref:Sensor histidine kinase inhibitor, KipI family n=1 Tax=Alkalibacterium pelagium TaxID=426702 RepID=A0A1H7P6Z1_9LACT|nr:5-oxoprolinase subunit PxpB [Alkalibacterium pelagium]GEN51580.1 allophanate hydrolase [Alkalibacterium pelagium]SEL31522.1 sensor histidine kinase inhibitor, KipI family [Alkalibacterium pelagium]